MTKRIIALVCVAITLFSLFAVNVSAYEVYDDYHEGCYVTYIYSYRHGGLGSASGDGGSQTFAEGGLILPALFRDEDLGGDTLERIYYLDFYRPIVSKGETADLFDKNDLSAMLSTSKYALIEVDENDINYREGCYNFKFYSTTSQYSEFVGNDVFKYDVLTEHPYSSIQIYVYIKYDGYVNTTSAVSLVNTNLEVNDYQDMYYGFQFNEKGDYTVDMKVDFYDGVTMTSETLIMDCSAQLNVTRNSTDYNDGYDKGYANGYNAGYYDGVNSDDEWTVISLLNAIIDAPFRFIRTAFDFDIFGVNVGAFVQVAFTLLLVGFVAIKLIGVFM